MAQQDAAGGGVDHAHVAAHAGDVAVFEIDVFAGDDGLTVAVTDDAALAVAGIARHAPLGLLLLEVVFGDGADDAPLQLTGIVGDGPGDPFEV